MKEAEAFEYIIGLVYDSCGVCLHEGKHELIRARLGKRLRHYGMSTLSEYCEFLKHQENDDEITQVVDSLTTNFTNFLREEAHFKFLVEQALPTSIAPGQKQFNIWSAACATGEEPYSLGFYLMEFYPLISGWNWRILATDISTRALGKAQQAIYPADRMQSVPYEWIRKYCQKGHKQWEGYFRIKPLITERIQFRHMNLLDDYHISENFSVIFCRNVMIYFDRPTQERLVKKLIQVLIPKGYLIVGHAESLTGISGAIRCLRPSIYQKV